MLIISDKGMKKYPKLFFLKGRINNDYTNRKAIPYSYRMALMWKFLFMIYERYLICQIVHDFDWLM